MACSDELLITYGLGYAFEKNKLLIISEIEEKTVLENEVNIIEEISIINQLKEKFHIKCSLKFPNDYISNIEEVLEEKLSKIVPVITSIKLKSKNMEKQLHLMEEYLKKDLSQSRFKKEGYVQKDSNIIKEYLNNCAKEIGVDTENKDSKVLEYNKKILRVILTSSFGNEFGNFLSKRGQAPPIKNNFDDGQLEYLIKNNCLIKKKYGELDFLNLLLFLEEWQKKHFSWDQNYTSLMFSIHKNGNKYNGQRSELKDFVVSFIKEKRCLYFPFGKYNEDNIFITLNDEKYINPKNKENNTCNSSKINKIIVEKRESNVYQITPINYKEINLECSKEIGCLLLFQDDHVYISLVIYDAKNEKVDDINKFEELNKKALEVLESHLIIEG